MEQLRVHLFRNFHFVVKDQKSCAKCFKSRKVQELFSFLLLNSERPHRREVLMTILWEESDKTRAQKYLRQTLWQLLTDLNACIGEEQTQTEMITVDTEWVQMDEQSAIWCDVVAFQQAFLNCQGVAGSALSVEQARLLEEAVILYHGDLLEGWYHNWCLIERESLYNMFLLMLEKLMDYCEVHKRYEDGIAYGMRVLKMDYARERTYRRLMRLYCLLGDRSTALRCYKHCEEALSNELDVSPSEKTQALFEQIRCDSLETAKMVPLNETVPKSFALDTLCENLARLKTVLTDVHALVHRDIEAVERVLLQYKDKKIQDHPRQ